MGQNEHNKIIFNTYKTHTFTAAWVAEDATCEYHWWHVLPWNWKKLRRVYRRRKLENHIAKELAVQIREEIDRDILKGLSILDQR